MNPHWSNTDFITQCRIACKLTIENVNAGQWLKQALDRLENAEAEITKLKTDVELMPTVCFLNEQLRKDVESLNDMLRRAGYGQGTIDSYAAQCEEIDRLKAENERLFQSLPTIDNSTLNEATEMIGSEFNRQQAIELVRSAIADLRQLRKENELLRLGWCRESEKRQQDWFDQSKGPTCET